MANIPWHTTIMFALPPGYSWQPPPHYPPHLQWLHCRCGGPLPLSLPMQSVLGKNVDSHVNMERVLLEGLGLTLCNISDNLCNETHAWSHGLFVHAYILYVCFFSFPIENKRPPEPGRQARLTFKKFHKRVLSGTKRVRQILLKSF